MEVINKETIVKYFKDGDFETHLGEFYQLIEELKGTDGFFSAINIHEKEVEDYLTKKGIIGTNVRGSSYVKDERLRVEFEKQLENLI